MVFLQLENGTFKEFSVPNVVSIGRGIDNNIQPESQSVSKAHAKITLSLKYSES